MDLTTTTPTRTPAQGLARAVWVVAGVCWIVTIGAVLLGGSVHGHHDVVLETSGLGWTVRLALFGSAWLVMVGAMMLPTAVPMLELFWTISARHPRPWLSRAVFVGTYLLVWIGFAFVALAGDAAVHALVDTSQWLSARPGLVLGGTLLLAGSFQFSALKKACLTACRSPLSVLWQHYRQGLAGVVTLGLRHAAYCLGCCWALMLVMFATGAGSLLWMLLLTGVMVAEKTTNWGGRLAAPAGIALIAAGLATAGIALFTPL
jgi:predicted metal-binding membrane protein